MLLTPAQMTDDWLMLRQLSPESRHHLLIAHFADLLLKRPTELQALLNLYYQSERPYTHDWRGQERSWTARQRQCVLLRREAQSLGLAPSKWASYVADALCITPGVARRILQRADALVEQGEALSPDDGEAAYRLLGADEERIKSYFNTHRRECAGSGRGESLLVLRDGRERTIPACKGWTLGNKALCFDCYQIWGVYGSGWPTWLQFRERDIRREFRREAISALRLVPWGERV